jgi:hypothetical protein
MPLGLSGGTDSFEETPPNRASCRTLIINVTEEKVRDIFYGEVIDGALLKKFVKTLQSCKEK